ncbi:toxin glutamine deamidase domain-containing protein [Micromonospora sp. NPDC049230]|uniref:WXG100-like domain-containing protein n=1 Tax=Micromonospora sp. NPDC049230 TaxID=3155502 RepID=UPI0033CC6EFA
MDTPIPDWLNHILNFFVGATWPTGSESGMRAHSGEWEHLRDVLDEARETLVAERSRVPAVLSGQFADGVTKSLDSLVDYLDQLRSTAESMRKDLKNGAAELQEQKILLVVQLALLAIQLAWLMASLFGALAIPLVVGGFRAVITAILRNLFVEVGQEIAQEPLLMIVIQAAQDADGVREGIDWNAIKKTLIQTVIVGAAAGLANSAASGAVDWAAGRIAKVDRVGADGTLYITDGVFRAGALFTKGAAQAAVAMPATAAGQAAVGERIEWRPWTATSAFFGGLYEGNAASPGQLADGLNLPYRNGYDKAAPLGGDGQQGGGDSGVNNEKETPSTEPPPYSVDDGNSSGSDWDNEKLVGDEKSDAGTGDTSPATDEVRQSLLGDSGVGTGLGAGLGAGASSAADQQVSTDAGTGGISEGSAAGAGVQSSNGDAGAGVSRGAGIADGVASGGVADSHAAAGGVASGGVADGRAASGVADGGVASGGVADGGVVDGGAGQGAGNSAGQDGTNVAGGVAGTPTGGGVADRSGGGLGDGSVVGSNEDAGRLSGGLPAEPTVGGQSGEVAEKDGAGVGGEQITNGRSAAGAPETDGAGGASRGGVGSGSEQAAGGAGGASRGGVGSSGGVASAVGDAGGASGEGQQRAQVGAGQSFDGGAARSGPATTVVGGDGTHGADWATTDPGSSADLRTVSDPGVQQTLGFGTDRSEGADPALPQSTEASPGRSDPRSGGVERLLASSTQDVSHVVANTRAAFEGAQAAIIGALQASPPDRAPEVAAARDAVRSVQQSLTHLEESLPSLSKQQARADIARVLTAYDSAHHQVRSVAGAALLPSVDTLVGPSRPEVVGGDRSAVPTSTDQLSPPAVVDRVEPAQSPTNEPSNGPASEPSNEPANGPSNEPANGPASEPANGPANGSSNEPAGMGQVGQGAEGVAPERGDVDRRLRSAVGQLPAWDRSADCADRVAGVLRRVGVPIVAEVDGPRARDVVAQSLGGWFGPAGGVDRLAGLSVGAVTPVWLPPSGNGETPAHMALVWRASESRFVLVETQGDVSPNGSDSRFVDFEMDRPPGELRGPVRLVSDADGALRQVDLTSGAVLAGAAESALPTLGDRVADALLDRAPHTHEPGLIGGELEGYVRIGAPVHPATTAQQEAWLGETIATVHSLGLTVKGETKSPVYGRYSDRWYPTLAHLRAVEGRHYQGHRQELWLAAEVVYAPGAAVAGEEGTVPFTVAQYHGLGKALMRWLQDAGRIGLTMGEALQPSADWQRGYLDDWLNQVPPESRDYADALSQALQTPDNVQVEQGMADQTLFHPSNVHGQNIHLQLSAGGSLAALPTLMDSAQWDAAGLGVAAAGTVSEAVGVADRIARRLMADFVRSLAPGQPLSPADIEDLMQFEEPAQLRGALVQVLTNATGEVIGPIAGSNISKNSVLLLSRQDMIHYGANLLPVVSDYVSRNILDITNHIENAYRQEQQGLGSHPAEQQGMSWIDALYRVSGTDRRYSVRQLIQEGLTGVPVVNISQGDLFGKLDSFPPHLSPDGTRAIFVLEKRNNRAHQDATPGVQYDPYTTLDSTDDFVADMLALTNEAHEVAERARARSEQWAPTETAPFGGVQAAAQAYGAAHGQLTPVPNSVLNVDAQGNYWQSTAQGWELVDNPDPGGYANNPWVYALTSVQTTSVARVDHLVPATIDGVRHAAQQVLDQLDRLAGRIESALREALTDQAGTADGPERTEQVETARTVLDAARQGLAAVVSSDQSRLGPVREHFRDALLRVDHARYEVNRATGAETVPTVERLRGASPEPGDADASPRSSGALPTYTVGLARVDDAAQLVAALPGNAQDIVQAFVSLRDDRLDDIRTALGQPGSSAAFSAVTAFDRRLATLEAGLTDMSEQTLRAGLVDLVRDYRVARGQLLALSYDRDLLPPVEAMLESPASDDDTPTGKGKGKATSNTRDAGGQGSSATGDGGVGRPSGPGGGKGADSRGGVRDGADEPTPAPRIPDAFADHPQDGELYPNPEINAMLRETRLLLSSVLEPGQRDAQHFADKADKNLRDHRDEVRAATQTRNDLTSAEQQVRDRQQQTDAAVRALQVSQGEVAAATKALADATEQLARTGRQHDVLRETRADAERARTEAEADRAAARAEITRLEDERDTAQDRLEEIEEQLDNNLSQERLATLAQDERTAGQRRRIHLIAEQARLNERLDAIVGEGRQQGARGRAADAALTRARATITTTDKSLESVTASLREQRAALDGDDGLRARLRLAEEEHAENRATAQAATASRDEAAAQRDVLRTEVERLPSETDLANTTTRLTRAARDAGVVRDTATARADDAREALDEWQDIADERESDLTIFGDRDEAEGDRSYLSIGAEGLITEQAAARMRELALAAVRPLGRWTQEAEIQGDIARLTTPMALVDDLPSSTGRSGSVQVVGSGRHAVRLTFHSTLTRHDERDLAPHYPPPPVSQGERRRFSDVSSTSSHSNINYRDLPLPIQEFLGLGTTGPLRVLNVSAVPRLTHNRQTRTAFVETGTGPATIERLREPGLAHFYTWEMRVTAEPAARPPRLVTPPGRPTLDDPDDPWQDIEADPESNSVRERLVVFFPQHIAVPDPPEDTTVADDVALASYPMSLDTLHDPTELPLRILSELPGLIAEARARSRAAGGRAAGGRRAGRATPAVRSPRRGRRLGARRGHRAGLLNTRSQKHIFSFAGHGNMHNVFQRARDGAAYSDPIHDANGRLLGVLRLTGVPFKDDTSRIVSRASDNSLEFLTEAQMTERGSVVLRNALDLPVTAGVTLLKAPAEETKTPGTFFSGGPSVTLGLGTGVTIGHNSGAVSFVGRGFRSGREPDPKRPGMAPDPTATKAIRRGMVADVGMRWKLELITGGKERHAAPPSRTWSGNSAGHGARVRYLPYTLRDADKVRHPPRGVVDGDGPGMAVFKNFTVAPQGTAADPRPDLDEQVEDYLRSEGYLPKTAPATELLAKNHRRLLETSSGAHRIGMIGALRGTGLWVPYDKLTASGTHRKWIRYFVPADQDPEVGYEGLTDELGANMTIDSFFRLDSLRSMFRSKRAALDGNLSLPVRKWLKSLLPGWTNSVLSGTVIGKTWENTTSLGYGQVPGRSVVLDTEQDQAMHKFVLATNLRAEAYDEGHDTPDERFTPGDQPVSYEAWVPDMRVLAAPAPRREPISHRPLTDFDQAMLSVGPSLPNLAGIDAVRGSAALDKMFAELATSQFAPLQEWLSNLPDILVARWSKLIGNNPGWPTTLSAHTRRVFISEERLLAVMDVALRGAHSSEQAFEPGFLADAEGRHELQAYIRQVPRYVPQPRDYELYVEDGIPVTGTSAFTRSREETRYHSAGANVVHPYGNAPSATYLTSTRERVSDTKTLAGTDYRINNISARVYTITIPVTMVGTFTGASRNLVSSLRSLFGGMWEAALPATASDSAIDVEDGIQAVVSILDMATIWRDLERSWPDVDHFADTDGIPADFQRPVDFIAGLPPALHAQVKAALDLLPPEPGEKPGPDAVYPPRRISQRLGLGDASVLDIRLPAGRELLHHTLRSLKVDADGATDLGSNSYSAGLYDWITLHASSIVTRGDIRRYFSSGPSPYPVVVAGFQRAITHRGGTMVVDYKLLARPDPLHDPLRLHGRKIPHQIDPSTTGAVDENGRPFGPVPAPESDMEMHGTHLESRGKATQRVKSHTGRLSGPVHTRAQRHKPVRLIGGTPQIELSRQRSEADLERDRQEPRVITKSKGGLARMYYPFEISVDVRVKTLNDWLMTAVTPTIFSWAKSLWTNPAGEAGQESWLKAGAVLEFMAADGSTQPLVPDGTGRPPAVTVLRGDPAGPETLHGVRINPTSRANEMGGFTLGVLRSFRPTEGLGPEFRVSWFSDLPKLQGLVLEVLPGVNQWELTGFVDGEVGGGNLYSLLKRGGVKQTFPSGGLGVGVDGTLTIKTIAASPWRLPAEQHKPNPGDPDVPVDFVPGHDASAVFEYFPIVGKVLTSTSQVEQRLTVALAPLVSLNQGDGVRAAISPTVTSRQLDSGDASGDSGGGTSSAGRPEFGAAPGGQSFLNFTILGVSFIGSETIGASTQLRWSDRRGRRFAPAKTGSHEEKHPVVLRQRDVLLEITGETSTVSSVVWEGIVDTVRNAGQAVGDAAKWVEDLAGFGGSIDALAERLSPDAPVGSKTTRTRLLAGTVETRIPFALVDPGRQVDAGVYLPGAADRDTHVDAIEGLRGHPDAPMVIGRGITVDGTTTIGGRTAAQVLDTLETAGVSRRSPLVVMAGTDRAFVEDLSRGWIGPVFANRHVVVDKDGQVLGYTNEEVREGLRAAHNWEEFRGGRFRKELPSHNLADVLADRYGVDTRPPAPVRTESQPVSLTAPSASQPLPPDHQQFEGARKADGAGKPRGILKAGSSGKAGGGPKASDSGNAGGAGQRRRVHWALPEDSSTPAGPPAGSSTPGPGGSDLAGATPADRSGWTEVGPPRVASEVLTRHPYLRSSGTDPTHPRTDCVFASIVTDLRIRTGGQGSFVVPESVATEVDVLSWYAGHPLRDVPGFDAVTEAMRNAVDGAAGIVIVNAADGEVAHAFNVFRDDDGEATYWDDQTGQPATAPPDPSRIRFVATTEGVPDPAAPPVSPSAADAHADLAGASTEEASDAPAQWPDDGFVNNPDEFRAVEDDLRHRLDVGDDPLPYRTRGALSRLAPGADAALTLTLGLDPADPARASVDGVAVAARLRRPGNVTIAPDGSTVTMRITDDSTDTWTDLRELVRHLRSAGVRQVHGGIEAALDPAGDTQGLATLVDGYAAEWGVLLAATADPHTAPGALLLTPDAITARMPAARLDLGTIQAQLALLVAVRAVDRTSIVAPPGPGAVARQSAARALIDQVGAGPAHRRDLARLFHLGGRVSRDDETRSESATVPLKGSAALTGDGLRRLFGEVVAAGRVVDPAGRVTVADCLAVVRALVSRLFPGGPLAHAVRVPRTRDDSDLGRPAEAWLGDRRDWERFDGWDALTARLGADDLGRRSVAVVLVERTRSGFGHVYAAYHTADEGVLWLNLTDPGAVPRVGVPQETPGEYDADIHARALVIGPDGVVRGGGTSRPPLAEALVDPVASRGYRGGGLEGERTMPMDLHADDSEQASSDGILARARDGSFHIEVEHKELRYAAEEAEDGEPRGYLLPGDPASGDPVWVAMPELVTGIISNLPGEQGRIEDTEDFWRQLQELEDRFEAVQGAPGLPTVALPATLASAEVAAAPLASGTIGPPPRGDDGGWHWHISIGTPVEGLRRFLAHVAQRTWRDSSVTFESAPLGLLAYRSKENQQDGIDFGEREAAHFLRHFAEAGRVPSARVLDVVKGVLALAYAHTAGAAEYLLAPMSLTKAHVAALSRPALGLYVRQLPWWARLYLSDQADVIHNRFARFYLDHNNGYLDELGAVAGAGVGVRLSSRQQPWTASRAAPLMSPMMYLLSALHGNLVNQQHVFPGMTTHDQLDTADGSLSVELAVVEVRSYGARRGTVAQARVWYQELATLARDLYLEVKDLPPLRDVPLPEAGPTTTAQARPVTAPLFEAVSRALADDLPGALDALEPARRHLTVRQRAQWARQLTSLHHTRVVADGPEAGSPLLGLAAEIAMPLLSLWLAAPTWAIATREWQPLNDILAVDGGRQLVPFLQENLLPDEFDDPPWQTVGGGGEAARQAAAAVIDLASAGVGNEALGLLAADGAEARREALRDLVAKAGPEEYDRLRPLLEVAAPPGADVAMVTALGHAARNDVDAAALIIQRTLHQLDSPSRTYWTRRLGQLAERGTFGFPEVDRLILLIADAPETQ